MMGRGYDVGRSYFDGGMMGHGWSGLMMLGIVLVVGVVIYWALKKKGQTNVTEDDKIMTELKLRFVKGEITEEEYLQKKAVLGLNPSNQS